MVSKEDHPALNSDRNKRKSTMRQSKIVGLDVEDFENEVNYDKVDEINERLPYYNVLFTKYMKREGL